MDKTARQSASVCRAYVCLLGRGRAGGEWGGCLKAGAAHVHETHASAADGTEKNKIGQLLKLAARPLDRTTVVVLSLGEAKKKNSSG